MTAPLFNLPIASPLAAPPNTAAGQEPVTGFEALLAAFFTEPGLPSAEGAASEKDTGAQPVAADGQVAQTPSPETQALAAMLAVPTAAPVVQAPAEETAALEEETPAPSGATSGPAAPLPFPTLGAGRSAGPPAPAQTSAPATTAAAPIVPQPDVAPPQTEPLLPRAAAATDPNVAVPTASTAADVKTVAPQPSQPTTPAPFSPPPAPSAQPAPQLPPPAAAAPIVPPAMAQAQALAADVPLEPAPRAPARNARPADVTARGATQITPSPTGEALPPTAVAPAAHASGANAAVSGQAASAMDADVVLAPRSAESETAADAPDIAAPPAPATPAAHAAAPAAAAPARATSETVANLTAQISNKLEGHSTKFDVELNPAGLGRVSVSVEIAASGKMTAAMSFDSPQAAAELRARSSEIQRALEQAGFDLSGGLSFDVAGDRGDGRGAPQQQQNDGAAWRGRAFHAVLGTVGEAAEAASSLALNHGRPPTTGVDVRI